MDIAREQRRSQVVNLTPLIDVVFLLIVFFMLSTSFVVSESMELSLPSDHSTSVSVDEVWVVRVKADDTIIAGEDSLRMAAFNREVKAQLASDQERKMLVLAEKGSTVQQLVTVLDTIYMAGGRQVQIDHGRDE